MKFIDHLEEWFIALLISAATLIIFVAVIHRHLSGYAIPYVQDWLLSINMSWAQELTIILFVWMAKFGAAYGVRTGIHVGVDVLINSLEDKWRRKLVMFGLGAGAFFTGFVAVLGARLVWGVGLHHALLSALDIANDVPEGPHTPDLDWPKWFVYSAVPLGSALMSFRFMQVMWQFFKTGELPHHDHNHVEGIDEVKLPVAPAAEGKA
jgi:C4-dicarboxylate transporter DctQ subunit